MSPEPVAGAAPSTDRVSVSLTAPIFNRRTTFWMVGMAAGGAGIAAVTGKHGLIPSSSPWAAVFVLVVIAAGLGAFVRDLLRKRGEVSLDRRTNVLTLISGGPPRSFSLDDPFEYSEYRLGPTDLYPHGATVAVVKQNGASGSFWHWNTATDVNPKLQFMLTPPGELVAGDAARTICEHLRAIARARRALS